MSDLSNFVFKSTCVMVLTCVSWSNTGFEGVGPVTLLKSAKYSETVLNSNAAQGGSSRRICSNIVLSSGCNVVGTVAVLIGEPRARAPVIDLGLVVAELFVSFARALPVGLASGIGEVNEVPARESDYNWVEHVVWEGVVSLMSKPVDLATAISFKNGTGRVVALYALVCDVGVFQGAEGTRDTGLFGCEMRNCKGPAEIASPPDTGARCFVAAPLVGIGVAPSTNSEIVAVPELAAASSVIFLVVDLGAVIPLW